MRVYTNNHIDAIKSFDVFDEATQNNFRIVKYLDLGVTTVRLIINSKEILSLIEHQLSCSLLDFTDTYSSTIVVWNELHPEALSQKIQSYLGEDIKIRIRLQKLLSKSVVTSFDVFDKTKNCSLVSCNCETGIINAYNALTNTYYYGVQKLDPEEFLKEGHIFVQILNKILKTPNSNLVHGAVVGLDNKGILFCARGQRGKSTLSVLSMLEGFEYVSDDYLVLEQSKSKLFSYPIYSIITLSSKMYNKLFDKLNGVKFISNNGRKDKYVFNIDVFHKSFRKKYPIELCMFPEIVSDAKPSIIPCKKGRAITQIVQSTVSQMGDMADSETIRKLISMVSKYEYYQINLCSDINLNVDFLRDFLNNYKYKKHIQNFDDEYIEDITFDIANIINCKTGALYTMNKAATNIYEMLKNGLTINEIKQIVNDKLDLSLSHNLLLQLDKLDNYLSSSNDFIVLNNTEQNNKELNFDFIRDCNYNLSIIKHFNSTSTELLN